MSLLPIMYDHNSTLQAQLPPFVCATLRGMTFCPADVSVNATFRGFRPDQVIHAPTDIGLLIPRVQVLSSSDTAAASRLNQAITLAPYNTSGMLMRLLCNAHDSILTAVLADSFCCRPSEFVTQSCCVMLVLGNAHKVSNHVVQQIAA